MLEFHIIRVYFQHSPREIMDFMPGAEFFLKFEQRQLDILTLGIIVKDLAVRGSRLCQTDSTAAVLLQARFCIPFKGGRIVAFPVEVERVPAGSRVPVACLKSGFRHRVPLPGLLLAVEKKTARTGQAEDHKRTKHDKRDDPQSP